MVFNSSLGWGFFVTLVPNYLLSFRVGFVFHFDPFIGFRRAEDSAGRRFSVEGAFNVSEFGVILA